MSEVATSQPPPATDGGTPWGSFYTAPDGGSAPAAAKATTKAKRKRSSEPKPKSAKKSRRPRGSRTGGGRRSEDRRRSFSLQRRSKKQAPQPDPVTQDDIEPGLPPVAAPAHARRYAEPHVLVAVVGGTVIALAGLLIALLYMIGNAA